MNLKKYILVAKGIIDETLTYRLNFVTWRVRVNFQLLMLYYLWTSIIPQGQVLFGYDRAQMITYLFLGTIIGNIVFSTRAGSLGDEINSGDLSNYLIKPYNYFLVWAARDVGDKIMNIGFGIVELTILFLLLRPPFLIQTDLVLIGMTIVAIILATIMQFFFQLLLGCIGFWSNEIWAPRFIFTILLQFFTGGLFPLDILPKPLFTFFQATPFPYLLFFPIKLYLGQLSHVEIYQGLFMSFAWTILLFLILRYVWSLGLKSYSAQGR